jgi:hypothetical protein
MVVLKSILHMDSVHSKYVRTLTFCEFLPGAFARDLIALDEILRIRQSALATGDMMTDARPEVRDLGCGD